MSELEEQKKAVWPAPIVEIFNDPEWPNLEAEDSEVLKWVTSSRKLLLKTVTWNLCAKNPPPKEELCASLLVNK
jgi:hypothetical protein